MPWCYPALQIRYTISSISGSPPPHALAFWFARTLLAGFWYSRARVNKSGATRHAEAGQPQIQRRGVVNPHRLGADVRAGPVRWRRITALDEPLWILDMPVLQNGRMLAAAN
jgi:hypothetical protein